jgi:hypothetical protein
VLFGDNQPKLALEIGYQSDHPDRVKSEVDELGLGEQRVGILEIWQR